MENIEELLKKAEENGEKLEEYQGGRAEMAIYGIRAVYYQNKAIIELLKYYIENKK